MKVKPGTSRGATKRGPRDKCTSGAPNLATERRYCTSTKATLGVNRVSESREQVRLAVVAEALLDDAVT
jgi:hypothetical protein